MNNLQQFMEKCPCPVVAVTGGDGRSTVAQLLFLMLSEAGKNVYLCEDGVVDVDGADFDLMNEENAGNELLGKLTQDSFLIVEGSTTGIQASSLNPHVTVVVGDIADVKDVDALVTMLSIQKPEGFSIVSVDRSYGEQLQAKSVAQKFPISRTQAVVHGAHIEGPAIIFCAPGVCQMVGNMSKVLLKGADDPENILAAVAAARVLQIPAPAIQKVLYSFEGDEAELKDSEV
jgi:UDP-N-acetylmuramoylalanine--D-glutamate ligase